MIEGFVRKIVGPTDAEFDRIARITRLATYNSERGRGIVHTEEWTEFMAAEQKWWDTVGSKCPNCGGSGEDMNWLEGSPVVCRKCKGTGRS